MKTATIALNFPPSVNNLFATRGGRRVPSPAYREWRDVCGWMLKAQKPDRFIGRVHVQIMLVAPDRRRRDADNGIKPVLDLLVTHGVIEGDDQRYVRSVTAAWDDVGAPCTVTISTVQEASGSAQ